MCTQIVVCLGTRLRDLSLHSFFSLSFFLSLAPPLSPSLPQIGQQVVPKEVALLNCLKHKYIIKMLDYFEDCDSFYIVMERPEKYIDLFDYISGKRVMSERSARLLFQQVWNDKNADYCTRVYSCLLCLDYIMLVRLYLQWKPFISGHILGWGKVSQLMRCPDLMN